MLFFLVIGRLFCHAHVDHRPAGGRLEQRLPDTVPEKGKLSLGLFQFTGALPLDLDFSFVAGVVDPGEV